MTKGLQDDQFSEIRKQLTKDANQILHVVTTEEGHLGDIISSLKTTISSIELKVESLKNTFQKQKKNKTMNKEELIKQFKFHFEKTDIMDAELAKLCQLEIEPLINDGKYQEAKDAVYNFYGNIDFSIEKDLIIANLNQRILKQYKAIKMEYDGI